MSHQSVLGRTFLLTILAINGLFVNMLGINMFLEILLLTGEVPALRALVASRRQGLHHAVDVLCVQGQAWKWSKNKQNENTKQKRMQSQQHSISIPAVAIFMDSLIWGLGYTLLSLHLLPDLCPVGPGRLTEEIIARI